MNRRDLLKGLAALPLSAGLRPMTPALAMSGCQPTGIKIINVFLSGPFAVVLQKDKNDIVTKVFAFAPMADNGEHFFSVNGSPPDQSKPLHLALSADGLTPTGGTVSFIDPGFKDFQVPETLASIKVNNPFVYIDLPCPDLITYLGAPATGHFKSSSTFSLPLNHALLYRVDHGPDQDQNPIIKMTSDRLGDICLDNAGDAFVIEVGRQRHLPGGTRHAVDFFNLKLLPCFPDVKGKELTDITLASMSAKGTGLSSRATTASTLECKNGGLIVTTTS